MGEKKKVMVSQAVRRKMLFKQSKENWPVQRVPSAIILLGWGSWRLVALRTQTVGGPEMRSRCSIHHSRRTVIVTNTYGILDGG